MLQSLRLNLFGSDASPSSGEKAGGGFRFEYSQDGTDRHIARIVLHGERLVAFTGPAAATGAIAMDRDTAD